VLTQPLNACPAHQIPTTYRIMSAYPVNRLARLVQAKPLVYLAKILTTLPDLPVRFVSLPAPLAQAPRLASRAFRPII